MISRLAQLLLGPWRPASVIAYAAAILLLCVSVGVIGLRITDQTNHEVEPFDQGAYIAMSKQMESSWYPWYSDGTRNPLFPWLAATFLDPNNPEFFETGKKLNVVFAVCGTAILGLFFALRLDPLAAFSCTALGSLGALLPISTFFGAEAIFLLIFLLVCACAMRLLNENPISLYLLLGILTAFAWLAKSSTTPVLALFVFFSLGRWILNVSNPSRLPWHLRAPGWSARRFGVGLALCAAIYFALISPRLLHAHKEWGSAFYSLPSFWFWADDWETCVRKYADCRKVRLAGLPIEEQPTMAGYFHRHDVGDALERLRNGAAMRLGQLFHPEGKWRLTVEKRGKPRRIVLPHRGFYLVGLGVLGLSMGAFAMARRRLEMVGPVSLPLLLGLATFVVYVLATGWYLPTGPGHRFIMILYLPLLWMLAQGGQQLRSAADSRSANVLYLITHLAICILLLFRIVVLLQDTRFEKVSYAF